jgi:hypothetical protein
VDQKSYSESRGLIMYRKFVDFHLVQKHILTSISKQYTTCTIFWCCLSTDLIVRRVCVSSFARAAASISCLSLFEISTTLLVIRSTTWNHRMMGLGYASTCSIVIGVYVKGSKHKLNSGKIVRVTHVENNQF